MTTSAYQLLEPTDPAHRQFIRAAMLARDRQALQALRNRVHLPIHFVNNWFYYGLMRQGHPPEQAVVILSPASRLEYDRLMGHSSSPIPLDTYDFLR